MMAKRQPSAAIVRFPEVHPRTYLSGESISNAYPGQGDAQVPALSSEDSLRVRAGAPVRKQEEEF